MKHSANQAARPAFTLLEILIVISIIGLLAALLFPVFARVRESGRTQVCSSNLRQLGLAFTQYTQDYGGRFPGSGAFQVWGSPGSWVGGTTGKPIADITDQKPIPDLANASGTGFYSASVEKGALFPYAKSAAIYVCPSNADGEVKKLTYSMNCAIGFMGSTRIVTPAEIVLLVDEEKANDGFFYATDNTASGATGNSTDSLTVKHNGGGNLLFCDGHVKHYNIDSLPLVDNATNPQAATIKYRTTGDVRFHDKRFGPKGSYYTTGKTDQCFGTIP